MATTTRRKQEIYGEDADERKTVRANTRRRRNDRALDRLVKSAEAGEIDLTGAPIHHPHGVGIIYGEQSDVVDPAEVLLDEIRNTAGHIAWLRLQIQKSDPDQFVHSLWLHARQSGFIAPSELDTSEWSAAGALWVELYMKERQHLAAICRTALAAGIEERRVRLAERLAERVGEAIKNMLYDLGLDPEDDAVRSIVFRHLSAAQGVEDPRAIASGGRFTVDG
jgi:hypothetical protein